MPGPGCAFDLFVAVSEVSCVEVLAVIQSYSDCECDVETMLIVATHLERCCGCCEELEGLRWLKAAVRRCSGAPESRLWH
jgi:hypothetical protein